MNQLTNNIGGFLEIIRPLGQLTSVRPIMNYLGSIVKRLVDPLLDRYGQLREAKTQEILFREYPLKRVEILQKLIGDNLNLIPEATREGLDNAFKIAEYCVWFIDRDKDKVEVAPDTAVDAEWINRFADEAVYVSDDMLQQLFGRLLKEKIYKPDAVNKRVLSIISDMDASELETIQDYMSCFLEDAIPIRVIDEFDFGLEMLLELQNMRLVNFVNAPDANHAIQKTYHIGRSGETIDFKGGQIVFSDVADEFTVNFDSYLLTKEGKVVFDMMETPMRKDVQKMYREIFETACGGKARVEMREV